MFGVDWINEASPGSNGVEGAFSGTGERQQGRMPLNASNQRVRLELPGGAMKLQQRGDEEKKKLERRIMTGSGGFSITQFPDDADPISQPDIESLRRLSDHLLSLHQSPDFDFFADACIVVGGNEFPVHRCLLSARSPFFRDFFVKKEKTTASDPIRVEMKELVGEIVVGFETFSLVAEYLYSGRLGC
ncbi:Regulatory protein NPR1 [Platanthera guangdongensis]|uniref:Regulatory protein NPR1 n=1 Tax=Platanthera guangdongensis TaxID=2320717 RepID=A0ABR2M256_9ASPA